MDDHMGSHNHQLHKNNDDADLDLDIEAEEMKNDSRDRICDFCGKGFSSGKALGGHRRIHFQAAAANKKNNGLVKSKDVRKSCVDMKIKCWLCFKSFPSMKSLFGHMRNHPERRYRGMKPPPTFTHKPYLLSSSSSSLPSPSSPSSCYSSTLSQESDENETLPVDLLKNWSSKDIRGRKSLVDEDATIEAAAHSLMKIWQATLDYYHAHQSSLMSNNLKIEPKLMKTCTSDGNMNVLKKLMPKKKIKKPQNWKGNASILLDENRKLVSSATSGEFRCSTCDKCFPTFQALGGHRSIHSRERSSQSLVQGESEVSFAKKTMWQYMSLPPPPPPLMGTNKLHDFDLNEPAANEDDEL